MSHGTEKFVPSAQTEHVKTLPLVSPLLKDIIKTVRFLSYDNSVSQTKLLFLHSLFLSFYQDNRHWDQSSLLTININQMYSVVMEKYIEPIEVNKFPVIIF